MIEDRELQAERAYLIKLAYRMLGSASDAEEVAQETFLRWRASGPAEPASLRAWLTRAATRLCIDRLRLASRQREEYPGDELPEPLLSQHEDRSEVDETLSMALLATVQRLEPRERAVFLLHDVFSYSFNEVAEILDLRADHCRQLAVRARRDLQLENLRSETSPAEVERLTAAFFAAIESGDLDGLKETLSEEVLLRSDGGGRVAAAGKPLRGLEAVLAFLDKVLVRPGPDLVRDRRPVWFNGSPGVLVSKADGQLETAFHFLVRGGRILGIYAQRNPDKLQGFAAIPSEE